MRVKLIIALAVGTSALSGCATIMEQGATKKLQASCAEKGMQFVKTESKKTEALVYSGASVTGECVGPTDPRWVEPEDTSTN